MAHLYFRYATMSAGKSLDLLKVAYNYESQNKNVLCFTPNVDTRDGIGYIKSRVAGIEREAIPICNDTNVYDLFVNRNGQLLIDNQKQYACILVDESQFLTKDHVLQFAKIVDDLDVPVICYGLKNDSRNELFEGSYHLLIQAEKIEEIKTTCTFCTQKATMVLRLDENGNPDYGGPQIKVGYNYNSVCRRCYKNPPISKQKVFTKE